MMSPTVVRALMACLVIGGPSCGGPVEPPDDPPTGWVWFKGKVEGDAATLASQWFIFACVAEPLADPCVLPAAADRNGAFATFIEVDPYRATISLRLFARAEVGGVIQTRLLEFPNAALTPVGGGEAPDTLKAVFTEDTIISGV